MAANPAAEALEVRQFEGDRENPHALRLDFSSGVLTGRLIHPEGGCQPATTCAECGADYSKPDSERCIGCKDMEPIEGECWLQSWFEQYTVEEILEGEIEVGVIPECDGEDMTLLVAAEPSPSPSNSSFKEAS